MFQTNEWFQDYEEQKSTSYLELTLETCNKRTTCLRNLCGQCGHRVGPIFLGNSWMIHLHMSFNASDPGGSG